MLVYYKIILIGDGAVGKTALCSRFMEKVFLGEYLMTLGTDVTLKTITIGKRQIQLQIWDIAGQPFFESIRESYYRSALGALFVFDVTRPETLQNGPNWIRELWKHNGKGEIPVVILGNKVDLRGGMTTSVNSSEGRALAHELSESAQSDIKIPYLETSAKTGKNVEQAFYLLTEEIAAFIERQLRDL
ncbi:MAG: Rab family GTPase [Candidatus Heimdallarchaeota archaeon]